MEKEKQAQQSKEMQNERLFLVLGGFPGMVWFAGYHKEYT